VKLPRLLFIPLVLLLSFFFPGLTSAVSPQKSPAKKTGGTSAAPKKHYSAGASKKSSGKQRAAAPRRPATQQQPDEQRIREIQQALTDKGFPVDVNGVWGAQSVEALKRFQDAQNINNLTGRGKLDSLTLIALGLGPRREPPSTPANPGDKASTEGKTQ